MARALEGSGFSGAPESLQSLQSLQLSQCLTFCFEARLLRINLHPSCGSSSTPSIYAHELCVPTLKLIKVNGSTAICINLVQINPKDLETDSLSQTTVCQVPLTGKDHLILRLQQRRKHAKNKNKLCFWLQKQKESVNSSDHASERGRGHIERPLP